MNAVFVLRLVAVFLALIVAIDASGWWFELHNPNGPAWFGITAFFASFLWKS